MYNSIKYRGHHVILRFECLIMSLSSQRIIRLCFGVVLCSSLLLHAKMFIDVSDRVSSRLLFGILSPRPNVGAKAKRFFLGFFSRWSDFFCALIPPETAGDHPVSFQTWKTGIYLKIQITWTFLAIPVNQVRQNLRFSEISCHWVQKFRKFREFLIHSHQNR